MNTTKYNLSAGVNFQDEQIMSIDLGTFDTIEAARDAANKHMKTVDLEFDAEIEYDILEVINYGTDEEDGKSISSISLTIDKETCKEVVDTYSTPTKEECQKIVNGLPGYKVFVSYGAADCQEHEIEGEQIEEYI